MKISSKDSVLSMSPNHPHVATAKSGDTVIFETLDCFSNNIRREDQLFTSVGWDQINPATGPLYVEEAKAGDTLRVEIQKIVLDTQGVIATMPKLGALGPYIKAEKTKIIPIVDNVAIFNDKVQLPCVPMIGVIGTAPAEEDIPTGTPGAHGGNMDCKRIGVGSVVYLPVNVDGAMLAMGDMHAVMGDGEIVLCGVEISGEITVKVDVIKGANLPLPMVVAGEEVMTIASALLLDDAAKMATRNAQLFLIQELGIEDDEAAMMLSVLGNLRICQIVDPLMTARMEMPLWLLEKYNYSMK